MIDFSLGEDIELAQDTARRFAQDVLLPQRREHEAARTLSAAAWRQASEIGFSTLSWPSELSGAGLGALAKAVVLEELAAGDAGAAFAIDAASPAADALLAFGGPGLLGEHLRPDTRAALFFDSRGALVRQGNRLVGTLPWLPADRLDVLVVLDRERLCVLRTGLHATAVPGAALQAAGASRWQVDAPVVFEQADPAGAARALACARLHAAALMVGAMRGAFDSARGYAVDRVAFGKPIAHHQALAFLIADMRIAIDGARVLLHEAAWRLDAGLAFETQAAAAFVEAGEAGMFVGPNGVQIYGAAGFMRDGPVEKPMRELRVLSLLHGGVDAAKDDAWGDDAMNDNAARATAHAPQNLLAGA